MSRTWIVWFWIILVVGLAAAGLTTVPIDLFI